MKKDSILEKALLQAKMLEEAVKTNSKGILASTMKEEINQLVKESLEKENSKKNSEIKETEDDDDDDDSDVSDDEMTHDVPSAEDNNDDDVDNDDSESEDEPMGTELPISDLGAGDSEDDSEDDSDSDDLDISQDDEDSDDDEPIDLTNASDDEILKIFKKMGDEDGIIVKKEDNGDVDIDLGDGNEFLVKLSEEEELEDEEVTENEDCEMEEEEMEEGDEPLYEIEFDDDLQINGQDDYDLNSEPEMNHTFSDDDEISIDDVPHLIHHSHDFDDMDMEDEEVVNPEEPEIGKSIRVSKGQNIDMGVEGENELYEKEEEMEENARTFGMGNRKGALKKGSRSGPKLNKEHMELKKQVRVLREKNEEYKKALTLFREKLNEVAVFNANLAYATRLFTEHATTKNEKLQILKRFDNTASLKESKNLYKTIKNEMDQKTTIAENVVDKIIKTPSKGSTEILAESQAYQSPQFKRMKDLFDKLKK